MKEDRVRAALKNVIDPELGINIVDLGLIYEVNIEEEEVKVIMTLTTPGCPLGGYFIEQVQNTVSVGVGIDPDKVGVNIVFDPPWIPDMMDEESRAELGLD